MKSYFPGVPISLQSVDNRFTEGLITDIRNDSIFVRQYDIRQVPSPWAMYTIDTVGSFIVGLHYKDIKQVFFKQRKKAFSYITDGTLLMVGGVGYGVLNVVNGKYLKEPILKGDNGKSLAIAAGVAGTGFLLNRLTHGGKPYKKYRIEYVKMRDVKDQLRGF
ncbi:MAG: hypothetical protein H7Y27_06830 [Gemmatimonadaceae bacterium]|nr:hypothetical protein [Chitinophagaceae bacterium]